MGMIINAHDMNTNLTPFSKGLETSRAVRADFVPVVARCSLFQKYL